MGKTQAQLQEWDQNPEECEPFQVLSGEKYTEFVARLISRSKHDEEQMRLGQSRVQQIEDFAEAKDVLGEQNALAEAQNQVSRDLN